MPASSPSSNLKQPREAFQEKDVQLRTYEKYIQYDKLLRNGQLVAVRQNAVYDTTKPILYEILGWLQESEEICVQLVLPSRGFDLLEKRWEPVCVVEKDGKVVAGMFFITYDDCLPLNRPKQYEASLKLDKYYSEMLQSIDNETRLNKLVKVQTYIQTILNPPKFHDKAGEVFSSPMVDNLQDFHIHTEVYKTIWPAGCTKEIETAAKRQGIKIHEDLEVFLVLPKSLLEVEEHKSIRVAVDFHGGGGFTGHPLFRPWRYKAWLDYMSRAGDMISIEPTYSLMPESSGREIRQDIADLWTWLVTKLETTVRSINPYITVNWGRFSISGGSFGGAMALELFHEILGCTNNSPLLRVRAMSLRYPVSEYYRREAGEYLGYEATKEEAERSSKEIVLVTKDRSLVIPRASSDPPNGMYGAYISSVSGTWPSFWNEPSTYERIYCMPKPQDKETRIRIIHGTEDKHVLLQDSVNLTKLLRAKGLNVTLCQVEGEAHAFDYDRPLDDRLRAYWDGI